MAKIFELTNQRLPEFAGDVQDETGQGNRPSPKKKKRKKEIQFKINIFVKKEKKIYNFYSFVYFKINKYKLK